MVLFIIKGRRYCREADNRILPFHWDNRSKMSDDYYNLGELNEQLLDELVPVLNYLHNVSESKRYWQIHLGYWLNIYTTVIFDRWSLLNHALSFSSSWFTTTQAFNECDLIADNTADFISKATDSSSWNHFLFTIISAHIPGISCLSEPDESSQEPALRTNTYNFSSRLKTLLLLSIIISSIVLSIMIDTFFSIHIYHGRNLRNLKFSFIKSLSLD